ncbi:hypothetical protein CsatB_025696 [Cannabis sativa]
MLFTSWFEAGLISWRDDESVEAAMVLWSIWNTRNDVVWNAKIPMMEEVIQLAKITYVDWFNAQNAAADTTKDHHEPRSDKWKAPEFPIIKVNVDGAVFPMENRFGVGLVARAASGVVIQAKTVCKLGALQPHEVKAMGMKANYWHDVIVESDCLQVISDLHCNKNMASPMATLFLIVRHCLLKLIMFRYVLLSDLLIGWRIVWRDPLLARLIVFSVVTLYLLLLLP